MWRNLRKSIQPSTSCSCDSVVSQSGPDGCFGLGDGISPAHHKTHTNFDRRSRSGLIQSELGLASRSRLGLRRSGHIAPTRRSTPSTRSSSETRENATLQSDVSPWPPSRPSTPRSSARVATSRTRARPSLHRPRDRRPCAPPAASPSAPPTVRPEPAPSGSRWDARSNRDDVPRIESRTTPRRRSPPIADLTL